MDNTQAWQDFALQPYEQGGLGLQPHQAAGVIGNLLHESGSGLPAWGPTGDNGTAWGTAQWRGDRLNGLKQFAAENGMDHRDPRAQMGWMRQELTGPYAHAYDALKSAKTPEEAASVFNRHYEVSADRTGGREATAAALANGTDPLAAINVAAGIKSQQPAGALSFSGDAASGDDGALSKAAPGASGVLFQGEAPNKLNGIGSTLANIGSAIAGISSPSQANSLHNIAQGIEAQAHGKFQYQMGPNGQLLRINKETNGVDSIAIPDAQKEKYRAILDPNTHLPVGKFEENSGTYTPFGKQAEATSPYGTPITSDNPYGLPADIEDLKGSGPAGVSLYNQLQGIHTGNVQYPTGSRVNKQMEQLRNAAALYFPDLNANDFAARKRYQEENVKQTPGSVGGNKIALNHSYNLIGQISDAMVGLDNSDNAYIPAGVQGMYNNAKNQKPANHALANSLDSQLMPALAGETGKLYYGQGAGGQAEREKISKGLTSTGTKQDQVAGLQTALTTLEAREADIDKVAQQAYGKDWEKYAARNDAGKQEIDKIRKNLGILKGELNRDGTPKSIPQQSPATAAKPGAIPSSWDEAQKAGWK